MSLDDFLQPGPPPRPSRRGWLKQVFFVVEGLAIAAVLYVLLWLTGASLPYALIAVSCVAVIEIWRAVRSARENPLRLTRSVVRPFEVRPSREGESFIPGGDAMLDGIRRWDRDLLWGLAGGDRFAATVGRRIAEIADERLRQHHGITRAADPTRAREIMGEALWHVTGPQRAAPTTRQLAAALTDLERI